MEFLEPCLSSYGKDAKKPRSLQLASAVAILLIAQKHDILSVMSTASLKQLLLGLRVENDEGNDGCTAYKELVEYHFAKLKTK